RSGLGSSSSSSSRLESEEWSLEVDIEAEAGCGDGTGGISVMYPSSDDGMPPLLVPAQSQTPSLTNFRYGSLVPAPLRIHRPQEMESQATPHHSRQVQAPTTPDGREHQASRTSSHPHPLQSHPLDDTISSDGHHLASKEAGSTQEDSDMHQNPPFQNSIPAHHHVLQPLAPRRRYNDSIIGHYMLATHT
ncbi:hypothetical protein A1O3_10310, partial [Capronia epimyces CBS 606.96]